MVLGDASEAESVSVDEDPGLSVEKFLADAAKDADPDPVPAGVVETARRAFAQRDAERSATEAAEVPASEDPLGEPRISIEH